MSVLRPACKEVQSRVKDQQQNPTIKKMEVVFEEVSKNVNDLPPDPNTKEEKFPIPWYLRIFYRRRRGRR